MYCNVCSKYINEKKTLKYDIYLKKNCLSIVYSKCGYE